MTKLLAARQIVTSVVTGILLWCVIGIGVSVLVSATLVLGYALFIVKDARLHCPVQCRVYGSILQGIAGRARKSQFGLGSFPEPHSVCLTLLPHTSRLRFVLAGDTSSCS